MRLSLALTAFIGMVPVTHGADAPPQVERLRKIGASMSDDSSFPQPANLRVRFAALDDKSATALRGMTQIGALIVEDASRLTDKSLAIIGTLVNLRELTLYRPAISGNGMASLKGLKELRKLYLFDAAKLYDSGLAILKNHEHLEELDLSGTSITNAAAATLKTLPNLKVLAVSKTKFGDAGAAQLKDMSELRTLDAVNSELSVKAAMALEAAVPGIRIRR